eukprot:TRINITY_DN10091_c0_g1_i1.p1 TRINITY_DN10091_c0_g1~~TRINITY_DN10091_c0_g1_i1.p1  ORF type:complete len:664 (-),score=109.27 TRINITY_DN10091_c0_g1_i1:412-2403(-)
MFKAKYEKASDEKRESLLEIDKIDEDGFQENGFDKKVDDLTLDIDNRITFSWSNINVSTKPVSKRRMCGLLPAKGEDKCVKHILKDVSGIVKPGELLAILGSSGAGKTTLLNTLLFRNVSDLQVSGMRTANNTLVTPSSLTALSAYVQQSDLFIGTLTVREHLNFQAMVRMDSSFSQEQRKQKVDETIATLGLGKSADTLIGVTGRIQGISGGEKKRLAFASEVLTNPSLFFCDEPTSGLDSSMAKSVVEVMKGLANQGRTVVCTIHQPSSQIYAMFDRILLLSEGRTAYMGNTKDAMDFFTSIGEPCPINYNPADHFVQVLAIETGREEECVKNINQISEQFKTTSEGMNLQNLIDENKAIEIEFNSKNTRSQYKSSFCGQMRALLWRSWLSNMKEPMVTRIRFFQVITAAIVFGLLYFDQSLDQKGIMNINGVIFLCVINMSFSNMFMVVNLFCQEIPLFLREHFNGMYSTYAYFFSKQIVELPIVFTIPLLFISIIYFMVGLNSSLTRFACSLLILELVVQCAVSFGYFVSCLASTPQIAMAMAAPLLMPLMLFGGFFINDGSIPDWINWLKYLSWLRYGNEAMMINQWEGVTDFICLDNGTTDNPNIEPCITRGEQVLHIYGFEKENFWINVICMCALVIGFKTIAFLALLSKTYRGKK